MKKTHCTHVPAKLSRLQYMKYGVRNVQFSKMRNVSMFEIVHTYVFQKYDITKYKIIYNFQHAEEDR